MGGVKSARVKCLWLLLLALAASFAMADGPKAGTFIYQTAPGTTDTLGPSDPTELFVRATLTPGKNGSFGLTGTVSEYHLTNRPPHGEVHTLKGTLTNKGTFKGTMVIVVDSHGKPLEEEISGTWNSSTNSLELNLYSKGHLVLKRNSDATDVLAGHYELKKKDVGSPPQPYLGWTGTISETTLNEQYVDPSNPKMTATLNGVWSAPPSILMPGMVVKLTGQATARFAIGFKANVGMTVRWVVSGDIEVLESGKAFAGLAGSGVFTSEADAEFQFRIGKGGGQLVISMVGGGNIGRNPCNYTYIWRAAGK